jgi:hypothetical protein
MTERSKALSVIDSLSKGFQAVYRRWWLVLIPILLDSLLWLGPRLSVDQLLQEAIKTVDAQLSEMSSQGDSAWVDSLRGTFQDAVSRYNAFAALRVGALGVPSLLTWGGARLGSPPMYEALWVSFLGIANMPDLMVSVSDARFAPPSVWQIPNQGTWLLLTLGLTLAGIGTGSIYLTSICTALVWLRIHRLSGRELCNSVDTSCYSSSCGRWLWSSLASLC